MMYADDTSVIMSGNDLKSLIQSGNSELCILNTWLKANKLLLNVIVCLFVCKFILPGCGVLDQI